MQRSDLHAVFFSIAPAGWSRSAALITGSGRSGFPALGRRRTAVGLPEHAAEQLVIGKAVAGKNLRDALVRVKDILADMGKTDLTDIFQKGNSHILFEKTDKKSISAHIKSE